MTEQYAVLAAYYDRIMQDISYAEWCDFYISCFQKYGSQVEKVIDLACGTGSITVPLARAGYDVTGIDLSSEMLALARKKADEANVRVCLSEQNIACFDAGSAADAVICSFDGINYLTQSKDVVSCFSRVHETLLPKGLFIFDVSTPYKYETVLADNAFVYEYDDLFLSWQNYYRKKSALCDFYLTFFVKDAHGWHRFDEAQRQRCYPLSRIRKLLKETGFSILETVATTDSSPLTENSDRCFFICKKEN